MKNKAALTAVLGYLSETVISQGVQCAGSRNRWGLSAYNRQDTNCWLNWSGWSECTGHCGQAVKTANRKCRGNIPGLGGCQGSELRRKRCSASEMVQGKDQTYCPYWSFWSEWTGCQVQPSSDPCIRNIHGYARRTRTCHDPYATERGETPNCQGEEFESRVCQGSPLIETPKFEQIDNLKPGYRYGDQWSVCSSNCGPGKQTCRLVHQCANVPGTWVSKDQWYLTLERACSNSCCQAGEWQVTEDRPQCFAGYRRQVRSWISYIGGPNDATPGQDCRAIAQSNPNMRPSQGNQFVEEIIEKIPVAFPQPNQLDAQFFCNEPQWSVCTPQQSPYGNVLTTCNMNGIRTRTWKHCCAQECESKNQYNSLYSRPIAGSECETWLQPPYVRIEQEACGPQAEVVTFNTCNVDPCNPVCKQRMVCGNEILQEIEIPCSENECGPLAPQQCNIPAPCTCGQEFKTQTCTQQCMPDQQINAVCPPNNVQTYSDEKWSETTELVAARNSRLCICKFDQAYMDFKYTWSRETSEDGTICSTQQIQKETRNNIYQQDSCLSEEVCQMDMCDRTCDLPNQGPQMYTCFRQDACRDPSNNLVPSEPRECPRKPSCCVWSNWEVSQECSNMVQCPSESNGIRQMIRREINSQTGLPDENCNQQEIKEEPCPRVACPAWENWSEWSQCSYILPDGTVCGGNRYRNRDYMCKNDVAQGNCLPGYSTGRSYSDGNFADFYRQIDSYSENHHSEFCWSLYDPSKAAVTTYLNNDQVVSIDAWMWFRDPVDNGCISGNSTHYREYRSYQISNKCIQDQVETRKEYRYVPLQNCVNEVIPETQLNSCDANISGPCCQYQNNGCSAIVQSSCIATDVCSQSRPAMPVVASAIQCPIMEEETGREEGPCYQTQDPSDDFCAGECEQTVYMKCGGSYKQKTSCTIAPRWSDWTPFTASTPFDTSKAIQMQAFAENTDLAPITVGCNPCGGTLESSRTLMCSNPKTEVRAIECPKPSYAWGEWSQCGNVCAKRPSERICTQVRYLMTNPGAEHCQEQQMETRTVDLPDCECPCVSKEKICQHQYDAGATCGTGHVHEKVFNNMCNCVDMSTITVSGRVEIVLYQNEQGQYEQCDLPYQPQWVSGPQSGCNSLDQICNGGVITQPRTLRCVEGVAPVGFQEKIEVDQVGICTERPLVQVTERAEGCQNECQATQNIYRECLNGRFEENCECMGYGRQCCQRNPEYSLANNGTLEVKTVSCGMIPQPVPVEIPDASCQCGDCGFQTCMQDPCTGQISNCVQTKVSVKGSYRPEIYPLSECQWDAFAPGQDKCNTRGFQIQKCVHACINNTIMDPPKIEYNRVQIDPYTDSATGFIYNSINGQVQSEYQNVQNCLLPAQNQVKTSECIHTDRCNPYKLIEYFSICDGIETLTHSTQQACVVKEETAWTAWSQCSVECGAGVMTRQLIEGCSGNVLDTEEKPCGCGISRWSEWSQWVGAYDPCGPEGQAQTSSRTCIEAQSTNYVYSSADQYVTFMSNGYYKTRINSAIDAECANKCNQCVGESVRQQLLTPVEAQIYNTQETCPVNVMDRCTTPYVLNKFIQCDKVIRTEQIPCPLPAAPATIESECSVLCGPGTKTITTQASICEAPVTVEVPCIGRLGNVVEQAATSWSACSKSCGGGTQTSYVSVTCELPDERGQLVEIRKKISRQSCSMHPCAYWGGWSSWSMCSSTCGAGQRQRTRKCEGGAPGTGGCTAVDEYFEVNGQLEAFTPTANGAVHTIACDDGPCCDFEWSGWSNCCIDGAQQRRLRWKGNQCTGEWRKEDEACEAGSDTNNLQQCNNLYNIQQSYFTGYEQDTIEITDVKITGNNRVQQSGWNVYYGRRIDDGMYTIGGTTYVLKNSGDQQSWFILNADNTQTKVDVEMFKSNQGYSQVYYYRFGTIWYKYINNNFVYYGVSPPPFYTGSSSVTTSSVVSDYSSYKTVSTNNYLMPTQYTIASSQSSGSSSSSSYTYYKPVVSSSVPQVTVTETKPIVSNNSAQKMVKSSSSSLPSAAEAPNAESLFGSW